jgi:hypothetical protein
LNVLTEEAHRAGIRVAAHTYSDEAARMAIAAGVDSIEHGLYLQTDTFRLMAEKGIYYVPTLLVYELWRDAKIFGAITPENKIKLTNTVNEHIATFKRALTTNVKIAFGTDTFELPGTNAEELELMVRYGMKPADSLRSATSTSAALLNVSDITWNDRSRKVSGHHCVPRRSTQRHSLAAACLVRNERRQSLQAGEVIFTQTRGSSPTVKEGSSLATSST